MIDNAFLKVIDDFLRKMESLLDTTSPEVQEVCRGICELLRIGRIDVRFYDTLENEKHDIYSASTLFSTDNYDHEYPIIVRRVTGMANVVKYRIYPVIGNGEWTKTEKDRIDVLASTLFVFNGRSNLMKKTHNLTYSDPDFGIPNVKFFLNRIGELMSADRLIGYAAIYFNLRRFSAVNLQIGRENGTIVMRRYINSLIENLDKDEIVCRIGGDNFTMLVKQEKLDSILSILEGKAIIYDDNTGERVWVSSTAGIYVIDGTIPAKDPNNVMDRISIAINRAKKRTKHDIAYFNEELMQMNLHDLEISSIFPDALTNEEFLVYYQPKICMDTMCIVGAEALCRWKHNDELISPAQFIPVLEKDMSICRLDFYMLDHVCRDIRRWLDEGKIAVKISVNFSRRHLSDMDLLKHIVSIIDKNNVPHEYIEIELTETTTDVEFKDLKRVIKGLQETGISTSVDDFGIGYSSLTLIKDIPWNVLKVDKSFLPVETEDYDPKKEIMLKHVVGMAQEMGLECVAEGVETRKQVDLLKENSCLIAQGYYFDRPLPIKEFETRLDNYKYSCDK